MGNFQLQYVKVSFLNSFCLFQNFNVRVCISLICQNSDIIATSTFFLYQISPEAYIFIISLHLFIQKNEAFSGIGRFFIKNREVY